MAASASPWTRRNLVAIVAMVAIAVVVIVVTAVMAGGSKAPVAQASQEKHPDFEGTFLDEEDITELMDGRPVVLLSEANNLWDPVVESIDPDECGLLASVANPYEFADVPWRFARTESYEQASGDGMWVVETAVLFDSPDSATSFFDSTKQDWESCTEWSYTYDGTTTDWDVTDFHGTDDLLTTVAKVDGDTSAYACQHALGVGGSIIAEAYVCGSLSSTEQAQTIVDELLAANDA